MVTPADPSRRIPLQARPRVHLGTVVVRPLGTDARQALAWSLRPVRVELSEVPSARPPEPYRFAGRSPRVRGRRLERLDKRLVIGKIPARAGTTGRACRGARTGSEDPRACGDDWLLLRPWRLLRGRSPRVRGRRLIPPRAALRGGKIPARAGTTVDGASVTGGTGEDPRACGDDLEDTWRRAVARGRSPRVRGRRPAGRPGGTPRKEDPRACGDDSCDGDGHRLTMGRSPRVRGRLPRWAGDGARGGKIPARAGTTRGDGLARPVGEEDPRACGDDRDWNPGLIPTSGRSPRVRGRPGAALLPPRVRGKIPARPGTTRPRG